MAKIVCLFLRKERERKGGRGERERERERQRERGRERGREVNEKQIWDRAVPFLGASQSAV